jgi:hypothetical protein
VPMGSFDQEDLICKDRRLIINKLLTRVLEASGSRRYYKLL